MNINKEKLIKSLLIIVALFVTVFAVTQYVQKNSVTLAEYAQLHPELNDQSKAEAEVEDSATDATTGADSTEVEAEEGDNAETITDETDEATATQETEEAPTTSSTLAGATLNGDAMMDYRYTYTDSFYYEPLSDNLRRYITGISFPATAEATDEELAITYDELRYVHILHYDFEGNPTEGELICNEYIAQDLVEIFYELYRNEYQLEKVHLIDEYDGDDTASMEDNNTSCFNYREVAGSTSLSKHALGLAIDINPLYNPYITYEDDGSENISPVSAVPYADRDVNFPYKIDENDLCYKLFTEHGFTWGGNWNSSKDYQHFQRTR